MGNHTLSKVFNENANMVLYEGDCLDLLKSLPDQFVDLVVCSPPYNLGKPYEKKLDLEHYVSQQETVIKECARVLSPKGSICWQIGNYVDNGTIIPLDIKLFPVFEKLGMSCRNRIVWHFGHGLHNKSRFSGRYEVILWFTKSGDYIFNLDQVRIPQKYPGKKHFKGPNKGKLSGNPLGKNPSDVWNIPNVKSNHVEKTEHPCQYPVELVERLVLALTEPGSWVLDPFCGTGSTLIAAAIHNRKAIGAEIMPEYTAIARERIAKAGRGELRIRPMNRPVMDPDTDAPAIPPATVAIDKSEKEEL